MKQEEMIMAVQEGRVLYGVSKKDYKVRRCKINYITFEHGKESMDCEIQLVGKKQPKHVGKMTIFNTRKEAKEWASQQMFAQLMAEVECKVVDAKHYVIEDKEGRQWRPVKDTQEIMCLSWDGISCLTFNHLKGMAWCPADWTPAYMIGQKLTYKWTAPCDK